MKKSIRILSFLMAFAMLIGSFSVMGSAYEAYKDSAVSYNDVDAPEFTTEQYASMALDELDRMLTKEKIELDIYIGKLDLGSVDTAITSVFSLVSSVKNLLPLLGDAASLEDYIEPLEGVQRTNRTDVQVCQALFNFIANIAPLGQKYVNGTISLGIMTSFIADFIFNVRELAIGILYGLTEDGKAYGEIGEDGYPEGYDYFDDGLAGISDKYKTADKTALSDTAAVTLLQNLINDLVLGKWVKLDDYFTDPTSKVNYDFYGFNDPNTDLDPNTAGNQYETTYNVDAYDYYGWVHPKDWVTVGLGGFARVANGAAAPAADYSGLDINAGTKGYDFIENLLRKAYNNILIPVLNRDTVRWVREECGIVYDSKYTNRTIWNGTEWVANPDYDADYAGEPWTEDDLTPIAPLFQLETAIHLEKQVIPSTTTLVDYFNTLLGDFLKQVANETYTEEGTETTYTWVWDYGTNPNGDNSKLFLNVAEVARFVLQVTGEKFFGDNAFKGTFPTNEALNQMEDQEVLATIMRGVLNSTVDYIYIDDTYKNMVDVAFRATEQLAWQDIPQFTYTKPTKTDGMSDEEYYDAVIDKMITILFDIAVYNLNQGFDMVPAAGNDPVNAEGLLQYQGNDGHYSNLLIQVVAWAFSEYSPLLALDLQCYNAEGSAAGLTEDMVWQDLDTIINALIPIKGDGAWIAKEIAGDGTEIVSKPFIFDYILKPIYTLDATNLATIFKRNPDGAFTDYDGVTIIIDILSNVFDLLFPGVFQKQATIDNVLDNNLLGAMVADLLKSLGTATFINASGAETQGRANDIILVGLPIVCMILGLSDDQEFEEMEIYLPGTISISGDLPTFEVINGSSGINTYHTAANGTPTQDKLYEYEIASCVVNTYNAAGELVQTLSQRGLNSGTKIPGGGSVDVTLAGTRAKGDVVEFQVDYYIYGEDGTKLTNSILSKTVYAYVGDTDEDDDNITISTDIGETGRKYEYSDTIYLSQGDSLTDIENYNIRIKDNKGGAEATATIKSVTQTGTFDAAREGFIGKNPGSESKPITATMTGQEGLYFFSPFMVKEKANGELYERFKQFYQVDEDGNVVIDETTEEPIPDGDNGGVEDGEYSAATVITVAGTDVTVNTKIHLYNDFGLESLFNRTVAANRQLSNYNTTDNDGAAAGLWNNYKAALMDAARLVLMPKDGDSFQTAIAASSSAYENKYEEYAEALEAAIEALDEYALDSGVELIKDALAEVSGINYTVSTSNGVTADGEAYTILTKEDIEYWEDSYVHFGMRDYVPHTYNRYREARNFASDIINSQEFFAEKEDPRTIEYHVATPEEIQEYNEYMEAYAERRLDMAAVNSIDQTYAIHMIELTSSRLIRLPGTITKLQEVYNEFGKVDTSADNFAGETKADYDHAVDFAEKIIAKGANARPSEVNIATTKIVETWKALTPAATNYQLVDAAITAALPEVNANGMDPAAESVAYTEESYRAFLVAYNDALRVQAEKPYTANEEDKVAAVAQTLTTAQGALAVKGSSEAVVEFKAAGEITGVEYWDASYARKFTPQISQGTLNHTVWGSTLPDGTLIDGFVVGYGVMCMFDESAVLAPFNYSGCEAVVTPAEGQAYSTGTVIQFKKPDGSVAKTYVVVVIGDVDNDNQQGTSDGIAIEQNAGFVTDWEYGSVDGTTAHWKLVAGDVTNDYMVDSNDALAIDYAANYMGIINQEVSPNYESSYIAN